MYSASTYKETLDFLYTRLPMYQRQGAAAYKHDLSTTQALDRFFQHPHTAFKSIHIAGTNGKGSVCHMLASILQDAGYKTGLFTSPHYKDFRERIRINGGMIPEEDVMEFMDRYYDKVEAYSPSFFELTFSMAAWYFKEEKVDVVVWETGMGGRLDSTNVVSPMLSVITNVAMDHTRFLGETLPEIAREKAGIIKKDTPIIIGEYLEEVMPVFEEVSSAVDAPLSVASREVSLYNVKPVTGALEVALSLDGLVKGRVTLPFPARYQLVNMQTTLQAIRVLKTLGLVIRPVNIKRGFEHVVTNTGFQGRFQVLRRGPLVIADSAHNPAAIAGVMKQLEGFKRNRIHIVLGVVNDKDISGLLDALPQRARYYFARADIPRGLSAETLRDQALKAGLKGNAYESVPIAFKKALAAAGRREVVFVGGSIFTVAEVL